MTKDTTQSLSPLRFLSGMKSLFGFASVELEERRKKAECEKLVEAAAQGRKYEATLKDEGYCLFIAGVDSQIETLRLELEEGKNIDVLRTRIAELRAVKELVPAGVKRGQAARAKLAEMEND